jgi:hypothetical protein
VYMTIGLRVQSKGLDGHSIPGSGLEELSSEYAFQRLESGKKLPLSRVRCRGFRRIDAGRV